METGNNLNLREISGGKVQNMFDTEESWLSTLQDDVKGWMEKCNENIDETDGNAVGGKLANLRQLQMVSAGAMREEKGAYYKEGIRRIHAVASTEIARLEPIHKALWEKNNHIV